LVFGYLQAVRRPAVCGRYTLTTPVETLAEAFGVSGPLPELGPSYNVAPTREVAAVLADGRGDGRRLEKLRWGLVPSWSKDPSRGIINARAETAHEKPSFRRAFRERRLLVLADGYYEWRKDEGGGKTPFYFRMQDGSPFAFAGLWEAWRPRGGGEELRTCALLTTRPNALGAAVHDRMPVILPPDAYDLWLDPDLRDPEPLRDLLRPYPEERMEAYPVSRRVNSPRSEGPSLVERAA
jgi:putative SOS response-associated peptidase YedK